MSCFKIVLEYNGAAYHGWQQQQEVKTVQGELNAVLARVLQHPVATLGASRTDAGVHARGQVACVKTDRSIDSAHLQRALNALLPQDIGVISVINVDVNFHPRFDAVKKQYSYHICNSRQVSVFERFRCWHVREPLDREKMQECLELLTGTHSFRAFSCRDKQERENYERTLLSAELCFDPDTRMLVFEVCGDAFLYKMVRILTSVLVLIGQHRIDKIDVSDMFDTEIRHQMVEVAPAKGLLLDKVFY